MRIIRYLENSDNPGIIINCEALNFNCACDASYATHTPNLSTKGHTGFIVSMGPTRSYVHARSGKQKTASTSSTDAEVIGMVEALKYCVWMRNILTELHITPLSKVIVSQDNKSVIMMGTEYTNTKKSKHILTKLTFIKSMQESGAIDIVYLRTDDMTADVLTKALHGFFYTKHVTEMMGLKWRAKFHEEGVKKRRYHVGPGKRVASNPASESGEVMQRHTAEKRPSSITQSTDDNRITKKVKFAHV